ncbi:MAG: sodium/proton-translocating pyrophosphatase, partial [Anaerolineales bacterium]
MMYGLTAFEQIAILAVLCIAVLGLLYALFLRSQVLRQPKGDPEMVAVWDAVREGADAYLRRQLVTILPLIGVLTVALFFSVYLVPPSSEAVQRFSGQSAEAIRLIVGLSRALAFVMGAGFCLLVGQLGMRMAVQGNVRVANAARKSFGDSLRIA